LSTTFGRLLQTLKSRKRWEKTILLLLSDHGECFGEGNFYFDHHGLYDAVTRIAMLLHLPGQRAGRIDALISTEDILPTLSELLDLPDAPYPLSGASLLPLLNGTREAVRPYVVSAESTRQASLALRTLDWKVILPIVEDAHGRPLPDFYGRPRRPDPLLFDLRSDPGETRDLSREQPDRLAAMLATLQNWRDEMASITGEPDPIQRQGLTLPVERFIQRIHARH
jgi:arylsulfatase A-like enzyme